jgi:hypothetical protein
VRTASGPLTNFAILAVSFMAIGVKSRRATPNIAARRTVRVGSAEVMGTGLGDGSVSDCGCGCGGGAKRFEAAAISLRSFISLWAVKSLCWRNISGEDGLVSRRRVYWL